MVWEEWNTFHLCTSVCCTTIQRKGVLQELLTLVELTVLCPPNPNALFPLSFQSERCVETPFFFFFFFFGGKAEGSSTFDWVIKIKSHPHWFILTHRCRTFELRWVSTVPPTSLLSSAKLGQAFEYSWSSMTTSCYSVSGPMLIFHMWVHLILFTFPTEGLECLDDWTEDSNFMSWLCRPLGCCWGQSLRLQLWYFEMILIWTRSSGGQWDFLLRVQHYIPVLIYNWVIGSVEA